MNVDRLNLLKIAPGGHLGRFCIWTEGAFRRLDQIYGTYKMKSSVKKDFSLPLPKMANSDLSRLMRADEVQRVLKPKNMERKRRVLKRNPLKCQKTMHRLNPYAAVQKRVALKKALGMTKKIAASKSAKAPAKAKAASAKPVAAKKVVKK